jgi:DNA-binding GntR family transcriptional regulator
MNGSLASLAYDRIRAGLVNGKYADCTRISEPGLARELGIGRTPVREAVRRLISEGLLEQQPKSGTFLVQPTREDLDEVLQLRVLLEPFVAGEAAASSSRKFVVRLKKRLDEMCHLLKCCQSETGEKQLNELLQQHLAADHGFHELLLDAAGNGRIQRIISDGRILTQTLALSRDSRRGVLWTMENTYGEHEAIYRAIHAQDRRTAVKAMTTHLKQVRTRMLEYFDWFAANGDGSQ